MKRHDKLFYGGKWQPTSSIKFSKVINPTTEEVIAEVVKASHDDVDNAVKSAKNAFQSWNETAPKIRIQYMEKVLQILERRQDELAEIITTELGASIQFSKNGHVPLSIKEISAFIEEAKEYNFEETIDNALIIREGFGVIACITPWNYPFNQIQRKITPALLAGNTVVVKPASETPLSAIFYAEILEEAGLPDGVFNLVTGDGRDTGDYLAGHTDIDVISFTGSTEVGKGLYTNASTNVKKMILELGGKSVMLYLKGGDLEKAIHQAADTVLNNQGQTCTALTRLLIPKEDLNRAKDILNDIFSNAIIGDPLNPDTKVGPMISKSQLETVLNYIEIGKEEGAEVLVGGNKIDGPGYFMEPAVFINATNSMRIAQEEIFGPVLTVLTYDTVEEAIEIANDSIYGLSGAVVGPQEEAMEVARQIRTGNIYVNGAPRTSKAPFGGYKQSGIGRENGRFGLDDAVEIKAIFR